MNFEVQYLPAKDFVEFRCDLFNIKFYIDIRKLPFGKIDDAKSFEYYFETSKLFFCLM